MDLRADCFESLKGGRQFQIRSFFKQEIVFRLHDLLDDPPPKRFHLIFLRNNLLTYYQDKIKRPALIRIIGTLAKQGMLIIGSHEKVPLDALGLVADNQFEYVLRAAAC